MKLGHALRPGGRSSGVIKGSVAAEPADDLVPGFSASGQDVWLENAVYSGPGLVVNAVGARCGRVFEADGQWGVVANTSVLIPQAGHAPHFLWYLVNNKDFWEKGGTAQPYVRIQETLARRVWLPSREQQQSIADYLDTETTRIDALIAKKRRLVELLDERFEAAVFHAVTRGVRGPRPTAPSRLSWVGQIPFGWGTPTVSANFDLQLGKMLNAEALDGSEQYPYVRNVNVQWDRIDFDDLARMHFGAADRKRCNLRRGDVPVCEGGEVGRAAVWSGTPPDCFFQKAIHRVRPRGDANGRYLMYCLRAAAKQSVFSVEGNQSTIVHLTGEQLRSHRFPWPPVDEQREIVEALDQRASTRDTTADVVGRQIDLLVEHRQALIAAAVTGELKIPGAAA